MILRPTCNFRYRKATDEELLNDKNIYGIEHHFAISNSESGGSGAYDEYFILEQRFESPHVIDGKREFEWRSVPIAENEK